MENQVTQINDDFTNVVTMIKNAQIKAYSSVNKALIDLYFSLGKYISYKVVSASWGKGVVTQLADFIEKTIQN